MDLERKEKKQTNIQKKARGTQRKSHFKELKNEKEEIERARERERERGRQE